MASIVPAKAHSPSVRLAVEPRAPTRHISAMSAKPDDSAQPQPQPSLKKPAEPPENSLGDEPKRPREIGGPKGPEPTRYGDWEVGGRCTDF
jgi:hypothetical protein